MKTRSSTSQLFKVTRLLGLWDSIIILAQISNYFEALERSCCCCFSPLISIRLIRRSLVHPAPDIP